MPSASRETPVKTSRETPVKSSRGNSTPSRGIKDKDSDRVQAVRTGRMRVASHRRWEGQTVDTLENRLRWRGDVTFHLPPVSLPGSAGHRIESEIPASRNFERLLTPDALKTQSQLSTSRLLPDPLQAPRIKLTPPCISPAFFHFKVTGWCPTPHPMSSRCRELELPCPPAPLSVPPHRLCPLPGAPSSESVPSPSAEALVGGPPWGAPRGGRPGGTVHRTASLGS